MASIKRALISVSDKTGIVVFAKGLSEMGVEILSTGGTAKLLNDNNIPVREVSRYTGFPEMMDGRLKTLHPKIHGGLLGRRGIDDQVMKQHDIPPIDLVVVNLYPFEQTVAKPDCDLPTAMENIDIGGPTMLRAAAKNYPSVLVVVDPGDYAAVLEELTNNKGKASRTTQFQMAVKTFEHTANYDGHIANFLGKVVQEESEEKQLFANTFNAQFSKKQELRYGENPHQKAAFYAEKNNLTASVSTATQIQGKELSYNNIADTDAALERM